MNKMILDKNWAGKIIPYMAKIVNPIMTIITDVSLKGNEIPCIIQRAILLHLLSTY